MATSSVHKVLAAGALVLGVALVGAPADAFWAVKACRGTAVYQVDFHFEWSSATHPRSYPADGHFSPPTVASHSAAYQMWSPGSFASQGIQNVAETGNPMVLRQELGVYEKAGHVGKYTGTAMPTESGTGKVSLRLNVDTHTPFLSAATMAAPSPDWFTGFHDISMCGHFGWRAWWSGPLTLYDAGTDSGPLHESRDEATAPPTTIASLRQGFPSFGRAFGWYTVKRLY
ncbi:hypothetical protein MMPV_006690 [Pyropia vietnamensis]